VAIQRSTRHPHQYQHKKVWGSSHPLLNGSTLHISFICITHRPSNDTHVIFIFSLLFSCCYALLNCCIIDLLTDCSYSCSIVHSRLPAFAYIGSERYTQLYLTALYCHVFNIMSHYIGINLQWLITLSEIRMPDTHGDVYYIGTADQCHTKVI